MARTREIWSDAVAEQLFVLGGELMLPFYFQPGRNPEHDKKFPVAYLTEDAAIDEMSFAGEFPLPVPKIYVRRDQIAGRVRANIGMSEQIEAERRLIAKEFRQMVLRNTVDLKR